MRRGREREFKGGRERGGNEMWDEEREGGREEGKK